MKLIFKTQKFCPLALSQTGNRDSCPSGNDLCDLIICHSLMHQSVVTFLCIAFLDLKLLLKSWKLSILKLCSLFQVIALLCLLYLLIHILDLLTKLLKLFYRMLFIVPLSFLSIKFIPKISKLLLKVCKTLLT